MLTVRSRVQPIGVWLVARLYREKETNRLRYSLRLVVAGKPSRVAHGFAPERFTDLPNRIGRRTVASVADFGATLATLANEGAFSSPILQAASAALAELKALGEDYDDAPLAVFAVTDFTLSEESWGALLVATLDRDHDLLQGRGVEVIPAPVGYRPFKRLAPKLVLPLNIRLPAKLAEALQRDAWFLVDQAVQKHGMRLHATSEALPSARESDIVVGDASDVSRLDAERWLGDPDSAARLRILVNARFDPLWGPRLVRGTASMVLPTRGREEAELCLQALFYELSHDRPLHYAMSVMRAQVMDQMHESEPMSGPVEKWLRGTRLYAEPNVDQWFRLSRAVPQAVEAASAAYELGIGGELQPFVARLLQRTDSSPELDVTIEELRGLHAATGPMREALGNVDGISFDRESDGLVPMSQILSAKDEVDLRRPRLVDALTSLRKHPGVTEALERVQERRVDASLALIAQGWAPQPIDPNEGVPSAALVRLSVHIGQRTAQSIIVGNVPALDPLLPEIEGDESHELEIVLLPKDFALAFEQPTTHTVRLSRFGGTVPVSWDLIAPTAAGQNELAPRARRWAKGSIAELRFSVYFRNQLLQSFNLKAVLGDDYPFGAGGTTEITCDFSQTRRFGALGRLGERLANLSLNENATGRHTLAVKASGIPAAPVNWNASFLAKFVTAMRDTLNNSLVRGGRPIFSFDQSTLALLPSTPGAFEACVREMATTGSRLRARLYGLNSQALQDTLDLIRGSRDETIQTVMLDLNYTLPWGLLYDFSLSRPEDIEAAQVCRGFDSAGRPCACLPDDRANVCLRGFWGFRHVVEQLGGTTPPADDVDGKISPKQTTPIMGFMRTLLDEPYMDRLVQILLAVGSQVTEYENPTSFTGLFADPLSRPSLVLYAGHQVDRGTVDAPWPTLLTHDGKTLFEITDVDDERRNKRSWSIPRSLVLVLGCETGAGRADTGFSLAAALLNLGAAGVIGTECPVHTDMVARVARDLRVELFNRIRVGEALKQVMWDLVREGCPMGLVFNYVGPVEARLP